MIYLGIFSDAHMMFRLTWITLSDFQCPRQSAR